MECGNKDLFIWSNQVGKFSNGVFVFCFYFGLRGDLNAPLKPFLSLDTQFEEVSKFEVVTKERNFLLLLTIILNQNFNVY